MTSFHIDILTILFVLATFNLLGTLFFTAHLKMTSTKSNVKFFILSKTVQGISWLLRLIFYADQSHSAILIADFLLIAGFAFESILFVHFKGFYKNVMKKYYWFSLPFYLVCILYFHTISIDIKNLITLFSYLSYMALISWHLLKHDQSSAYQRLLGFLYGSIPLISSILYVLINDEITTLGSVSSPIGILYYISILLMQFIGTIGFLLMVKEIDERTLFELATKDSLTGILNRKAFYDLTEPIFEQAQSDHQSIAFVMIDIDFFKDVNDIYGHHVGDRALVGLTATLLSSIRKEDILARFGGEEFVICLPKATAEEASAVVKRIQAEHTRSNAKETPHFTLSIGTASGYPSRSDSIDDIINQSDKALYYCKKSGRNCAAQSQMNLPDKLIQIWP